MGEGRTAAARRLYEEIIPTVDLERAASLFADDFVDYNAPPDTPGGPDGVRAQLQLLADAFDEQRYEVHQAIADGDGVALLCTWHARHTGEFMGIPPTGRAFAARQAHFLRFDGDDRITEHHAVRDDLGMLRQMGIAPG